MFNEYPRIDMVFDFVHFLCHVSLEKHIQAFHATVFFLCEVLLNLMVSLQLLLAS